METAWQLSLVEEVPDRFVRFGQWRRNVSITVINQDSDFAVEVRVDRRLLDRKACGPNYLTATIERAARIAAIEIEAIGMYGDGEA